MTYDMNKIIWTIHSIWSIKSSSHYIVQCLQKALNPMRTIAPKTMGITKIRARVKLADPGNAHDQRCYTQKKNQCFYWPCLPRQGYCV
jgi:hypothetical protein